MTSDTVLTAQLTECLVGDIRGHFFIPDYQRGYRWGKAEVEHLLNDVKESSGSNYYLQPVVVKRMDENQWELVDGQQRLTTLYLILQFIAQQYLPTARAGYSLEYETRPGSAIYLQSLDPATANENIDYFHIYAAYQVIEGWFGAQPDQLQAAIDFYTAASKHLRVIWYVAGENVHSKELFRRLNMGRIPLTDSELVKALLLARIRADFPGSGRAHEVAAQWDVIERSLRQPEVWTFISGQTQREATHIRLLLDALADQTSKRPSGSRPSFHTFETLRPGLEADAEGVWNKIQDFHSRLIGWYDDRDTFHLIGYLIAIGDNFGAIIDLSEKLTRSDFHVALYDRIRTRLNLTGEEVRQLTYQSPKCRDVLLLMNVQTTHPSQRFSFDQYASTGWSLEHIHAQNAEALTRAEQWHEWLRDHLEALTVLDKTNVTKGDDLIPRIESALSRTTLTESAFRTLESLIISVFDSDESPDETHSVANLALLSSSDNSALNNSVFAVKRKKILSLDKTGSYIPPCTRNIFLKYYTPQADQQLHLWSRIDRSNYLEALLQAVSPFMKASE